MRIAEIGHSRREEDEMRLGFTLSAMMFAMLASAGSPVLAAEYPDRPVKVVVPFPAGGFIDTVARSMNETTLPAGLLTPEIASVS